MPVENAGWKVIFPIALADIAASELDLLVSDDSPFLKYAFLNALEISGCVAKETGWTPHHFGIVDQTGVLVAFSPVYLKAHSYGEYVFDWAWADAHHRHGLPYYPKLLSSIPFTPSISARLVAEDENVMKASQYLKEAIEGYCLDHNLSSAHILFPEEEYGVQAGFASWMQRKGVQYHWVNRNYASFEDFLSHLNSSKRKNIRKERRSLQQKGLTYKWYAATDVPAELFAHFYKCYQGTYGERGQMPYLNEAFFNLLFESMPKHCLLLFAFNDAQRPVASALFLRGSKTLYGRYWGAVERIPFLHFELCYYAGIEYCITHGLQRFDAGAQGEHKLLRGFEPVETRSYHFIHNPDFKIAINRFLEDEREYIEQYREDARNWLPFKKSDRSTFEKPTD